MTYRLWVNDDRTLMVRIWDSGYLEVATRPEPGATWGPPLLLTEETPEPVQERERVGLRLIEGTNP